MAHLWLRSDEGEWLACALPNVAFTRFIRHVAGSDDTWVLLAGSDTRIRVNGLHLQHGISVLTDRDEIRGAAASPLFFSTERLAAAEPYAADGARGFCPRCKQSIVAGDMAVRCPGCGLWHHASDALPCWTYGEHCASCAQPTALDAGFHWTPEDL